MAEMNQFSMTVEGYTISDDNGTADQHEDTVVQALEGITMEIRNIQDINGNVVITLRSDNTGIRSF